jgi:hypothetical protein
VSVSELFARANPEPAPTAATATPAGGYRQAADLKGRTPEERPNGPETITRRRNNKLWRVPRRQVQTQAQMLVQSMIPVRMAEPASPNGTVDVQTATLE